MSSVLHLSEFIKERLCAAAAEIFAEFEKTIEEELERQRRVLDVNRKPRVKQSKELVCKEEDVLYEQQDFSPERSCSLDQEGAGLPQVKGEEDKVCSAPREELLKEERDTAVMTSTSEDCDWLYWSSPRSGRQDGGQQDGGQQDGGQQDGGQQDGGLRTDSGSADDSERHRDRTQSGDTADSSAACTQCDVCGKAFRYRYTLEQHYRIHTGVKPFTCQVCGKGFTQNGNKLSHMRTHTGEKSYSCTACGKRFANAGTLSVHRRTHTGERSYPCEVCGKRFSQSSNRRTHMRTHTGEKPFLCRTCGRAFSLKNSLLVHMRTHTGDKPFPCPTCGRTFSQRSSLMLHVRKHR